MVKIIKTLSNEELEKKMNSIPEHKKGQWVELFATINKTGKGVELTEISRGQAWNIRKKAVAAGLRARVYDKATKIIILPPEK